MRLPPQGAGSARRHAQCQRRARHGVRALERRATVGGSAAAVEPPPRAPSQQVGALGSMCQPGNVSALQCGQACAELERAYRRGQRRWLRDQPDVFRAARPGAAGTGTASGDPLPRGWPLTRPPGVFNNYKNRSQDASIC